MSCKAEFDMKIIAKFPKLKKKKIKPKVNNNDNGAKLLLDNRNEENET